MFIPPNCIHCFSANVEVVEWTHVGDAMHRDKWIPDQVRCRDCTNPWRLLHRI